MEQTIVWDEIPGVQVAESFVRWSSKPDTFLPVLGENNQTKRQGQDVAQFDQQVSRPVSDPLKVI